MLSSRLKMLYLVITDACVFSFQLEGVRAEIVVKKACTETLNNNVRHDCHFDRPNYKEPQKTGVSWHCYDSQHEMEPLL